MRLRSKFRATMLIKNVALWAEYSKVSNSGFVTGEELVCRFAE
mgnify:FL=1